MGYEYAELDAAARGLVLALMRYRDGATVDQLAADEYEGEAVPTASAAELAALGYLHRYRLDSGEEVLELMDRGWRWVEETARMRPTVRAKSAAFADADASELIGWVTFTKYLELAERQGDTIAALFPVEDMKPLRLIRNTRSETGS
jgi:hypothetical protein